jgi:hypothetical protein
MKLTTWFFYLREKISESPMWQSSKGSLSWFRNAGNDQPNSAGLSPLDPTASQVFVNDTDLVVGEVVHNRIAPDPALAQASLPGWNAVYSTHEF